MKKIIFLAALFISAKAIAQPPSLGFSSPWPTQGVAQQFQSTMTCSGISISSMIVGGGTSILVDGNTSTNTVTIKNATSQWGSTPNIVPLNVWAVSPAAINIPTYVAGSTITNPTLLNLLVNQYRWIDVDNLSASINVFCSDDILVSTQPSSAHVGFDVLKATDKQFFLVPGEPFYCVGDSQTAADPVSVCKGF